MISPPIMIGGSSGANFGDEIYQYLVSTSLIVSGILSAVQMLRFHIYGTKYFVGTGLLSVVGTCMSSPMMINFTHCAPLHRHFILHHHRGHRYFHPNV